MSCKKGKCAQMSCSHEFTQNTIKEPTLLSLFYKITSNISNSFELCNSEYNLNKWLSNKNMYHSVQEFKINNDVNLVSTSGEMIYKDDCAKGVLLPIQFQFKQFFESNNNLNKALKYYD